MRDGAVVDERDPLVGDLFAEFAREKGGLAIDGAAFDGFEDVAQERAGDARFEDDGNLLGLDFDGAEAAEGALGGGASDVFRIFESGEIAGRE